MARSVLAHLPESLAAFQQLYSVLWLALGTAPASMPLTVLPTPRI